jgi:hypothetical protein
MIRKQLDAPHLRSRAIARANCERGLATEGSPAITGNADAHAVQGPNKVDLGGTVEPV